MLISVVIRTFNEERYLGELLAGVRRQRLEGDSVEIVLVDSGSTDSTVAIANQYHCRIVHIAKADFTFGRSLNVGCEAAEGEVLVFVSGHCVPFNEHWLAELVRPIKQGEAVYSYGRQLGRDTTKFSEQQVFEKYFPADPDMRQAGFFCNNANAALLRSAWSDVRFDEELTGLEDLQMAKALYSRGRRIGYCADSAVYHIHDESWPQVRRRYEREALALQQIMPEVHVSLIDFFRYFLNGVWNDWKVAAARGCLSRNLASVVLFRLMQFWGTYRGNLEHRRISARVREEYFYPTRSRRTKSAESPGGALANEGTQRKSPTQELPTAGG